jgi:transcriptional regulator with XRE-family HTH domain
MGTTVWTVKSDAERGPFASWLRRERLARGWKEAETRTRLEAAADPGVSFSSYRDLEAGNRKPTAAQRQAIAAIFGAVPDFTTSTGDQSAVAAAIDRQTEATRENTAMLRELLEAISSRLPVPPLDPQVQEALKAWALAEQQLSRRQRGTSSQRRKPSRERPHVVPEQASRKDVPA